MKTRRGPDDTEGKRARAMGRMGRMNREEWEEYIAQTYGVDGERPWERYPTNVVFRHPNNRKWFAVLMTVLKEKLGIGEEGTLDIVNVKCDPLLHGSLRAEPGVYPAYHMNKANWVSISLDGSVKEETVKMALDVSFDRTAPKIQKRKT